MVDLKWLGVDDIVREELNLESEVNSILLNEKNKIHSKCEFYWLFTRLSCDPTQTWDEPDYWLQFIAIEFFQFYSILDNESRKQQSTKLWLFAMKTKKSQSCSHNVLRFKVDKINKTSTRNNRRRQLFQNINRTTN